MPEVLKICIFPQKIGLSRSKWCGEKRLTHKIVYKNLQKIHFICLFVYLFIYGTKQPRHIDTVQYEHGNRITHISILCVYNRMFSKHHIRADTFTSSQLQRERDKLCTMCTVQ